MDKDDEMDDEKVREMMCVGDGRGWKRKKETNGEDDGKGWKRKRVEKEKGGNGKEEMDGEDNEEMDDEW